MDANLGITTKIIRPDPCISDFVESFWMLYNNADQYKEVIVVPDGRIDLFLTLKKKNEPLTVKILGLGTVPSQVRIAPQC
jgi:hypothetical protein